ncbi:fatty acid desaturase-domain-containing protein [Phakopsora pachyrhizi]|uniref:Fatty acid desaturase-domain-containing protein n=1 Tax=Phakopsora pachyrhizi TaxID=170000 RepID=A0AAV0BF02_PHAPC|nr:fatty acid desaturase-domain-containing protein [Phakopsora pachyrhizi]CAH7684807.1 fatty acid desaturase-domain-containing protein [Phakopsora pachyrhizi]
MVSVLTSSGVGDLKQRPVNNQDRSKIIHLASSPSSSSSSRSTSPDAVLDKVPTFEPPGFTIKELLGCIPSHCFERSLLRSSLYVVRDIALTGALLLLGSQIDEKFSGSGGKWVDGTMGSLLNFLAWATYGYWMGLVWTGVWVLAHECGHQSFSPSKSINNFVGWVLHSALLVPFHSWRITHAQHHASTCHMTRDQAFVPFTRSQLRLEPLSEKANKREVEGTFPPTFYEKMDDLLEDAPLWSLWKLFVHQSVGFATYLLINASGQKNYPAWTNHFNPNSIMFDERHRYQVIWSDIGIAITMGCLTLLGIRTDFLTVFKYYIVPYLVVHHWIVLITFLQHTDPLLPHYREGAFNFQRGALSTMDRKIHGFFTHGLAETHVAHHLCSKIPHYHAWDATEALKAKLGDHYCSTDENFWYSLWKNFRQCRFVEDEGDVVFYKNAKGQAHRRVINKNIAESVSDSGVDLEGSKKDN